MMTPASTSSDRVAKWLFAVALTLGAGLLLATGPAPQLGYASDTVGYLDACHRASLGQWLGRDFTFPIGPSGLLPTTLAMKVVGPSVSALAVGGTFAWLAFGGLAWLTAQPRMPGWLAGAFALFVAATAAAPYTLDFGSWRNLSYGMHYNRLAWAALCIALPAAMLPRRDGAHSPWVPIGLGACTLWLWTNKPNYLLVMLPLVIYCWFLSPRKMAWLGRAASGAAATMLGVWLCVRFSPAGYVRNHFAMARSTPAEGWSYDPHRVLVENLFPIAALVAIFFLVLRLAPGSPNKWRFALTLAAVTVATLVANLTNCQFSEIPMWGALGWLAAALAVQTFPLTRLARLAGTGGVACGLFFTWEPLASIAYSFAWKNYQTSSAAPAVAVASPAWSGMPLRPKPGAAIGPAEDLGSASNYAAWLNDGLALLTQLHPPRTGVLCLDWTNPFPFATQTIPPLGDELNWHVGRFIGPSNHPDLARLLANASVVMEPLLSVQPVSLAFKRELFAPALAAHFTLAGETAHWRMWVRRTTPAPVPADS